MGWGGATDERVPAGPALPVCSCLVARRAKSPALGPSCLDQFLGPFGNMKSSSRGLSISTCGPQWISHKKDGSFEPAVLTASLEFVNEQFITCPFTLPEHLFWGKM